MNASIAILCAGGPAPGINTVVSTVAKMFLKDNYRVIGIHDGYQNLFNGNAETVDFNFQLADRIFPQGGSFLRMSRYKPKDDEFNTDFFSENKVRLLVTVGGDDTASTANRLAKFLTDQQQPIQHIHVPKTIDNDLPLPGNLPTFGFNSAKDQGVKLGNIIYEDARTSGNWFVISTMGRSAGHLAYEIGFSCHFPMIIVPEMFNKTAISFDKIIRLVISSMLKRTLDGVKHGVAIISEGVFHALDVEEIKNCGINFTYDDHGHPELGNVSKAHVFNMLVQRQLKSAGLDYKSRPVELGYELRTLPPIAFDLSLCTQLGMGVHKLFFAGHSGVIVSLNQSGNITALPLQDLEDPETGKIPPRLVDIDSELAQMVMWDLHMLTPLDMDRAKALVPNPLDYDFCHILNWEFDVDKVRRSSYSDN